MLGILMSWIQKTKDFSNMLSLYELGEYQIVYKTISHKINKIGVDNLGANELLLHSKAAMRTFHSRMAINDLTYLIENNHFKTQRSILHGLLSKAYLNIGSIQLAINESFNTRTGLRHSQDLFEAEILFNNRELNKYQINRLLSLCPESTDVLVMAANYSYKLKDMKQYERYLLRALDFDPSNKEIAIQLAKYYLCNMRDDDARAIIEQCGNETSCTNLRKQETGDIPEYCQPYDEINIERNIKQAEKLVNEMSYEEAYSKLIEIFKINPMCSKAFYQLARIFIAYDDYESALKYLTKAEDVPEAKYLIRKIEAIQSKITPFQILNVSNGVSYPIAFSSYQMLVRKWHPDQYKTPLTRLIAESKMKSFNKAIETIENMKFHNVFIDHQDMMFDFHDGLFKFRMF